jgi:hypothetical protein
VKFTKYQKDLLERVLATAAEAGISTIGVESLGLPAWAILPATIVLSAVKGYLAKFLAVKDTASLATDV